VRSRPAPAFEQRDYLRRPKIIGQRLSKLRIGGNLDVLNVGAGAVRFGGLWNM
jgi:hypothetical protein